MSDTVSMKDSTDEDMPNYSGECETTVDHYLITWEIREFLKIFQFMNKAIRSPSFHTNADSWFLKFNVDETTMQFCLFRGKSKSKSAFNPPIYVTYRVGVKKDATIWSENQYKAKLSQGESDSIKCSVSKYFDNIAHAENVLTVVYDMYIISYDTSINTWSTESFSVKSLGLLGLSSDLLNLFEKPQNEDIVIHGKNLNKIRAHKAILSSRCPVLAGRLDFGSAQIDVPEEDCEHIVNILKYIYSGRIICATNEGISAGLYECAQRYDLQGLVQLLAPSEITISSSLKVDRFDYAWEIKKAGTFLIKRRKRIASPPFRFDLGFPEWRIHLVPKIMRKESDIIHFLVKPLSKKGNVNFDISIIGHDFHLYKKDERINGIKVCSSPFMYNAAAPISVQVSEFNRKGLLNEELSVECKIAYSAVLNELREVVCDVKLPRTPSVKYSCLEELSIDLERLYERGDFVDYTIVLRDSSLNVHKAIISARSSILALLTMAKEENSLTVLKECPSQSVKAMFYFIYTGKLLAEKSLFSDLKMLAKKYSMDCLFQVISLI